MKKVVYRWFLSSDNGETKQRVYPIYKGDLALDYELESGQQFHRAKLSGKIDFVGEDYDWIMSQDLENDTIKVYLQVSYDNLATKSLYWQGHFTLTDMEVNADDKRIVVQPQVDDKYSTLLNGIETEYDLIRDLSPTKSTLNLVKGSIMQIAVAKGLTSSYFFNDYIDSVQGVDVWQEDTATDATSSNIMSTFKFGVGGRTISMIVTPVADSNGDMPDEDIAGTYVGVFNNNSQYMLCELFNQSNDSGYYIKYQYGLDATTTTNLYDGDNNLLYQGVAVYHAEIYQASITLTSQSASAKGKLVINSTPYVFYTRLLTDTDANTLTIMGDTINVESRPLEDITAYSLNYKKLATLADNFMDYVAISSRVTSSEIQNKTIYGRNSNGDYWLPPTDNQFYLPVAQTLWSGNTSLWVYANGSAVEVEAAQKDYRLNDAYNIADVISALLQKIDPTITHQATTDYSQFLYGVNPISETNERLFITPKSNVLSSEYSQAAQKGVITLKMVLDMLAKVYQCYWWVDDSNRLRIEHISYLMQGNSYTTGSTASVGVDLTTLLNTRNGKAWDYNKNSWTYEKYDMPERIVFKWMDDDVSNIFEGYPIVLQSPFIEKAKKDEQSVSNFTTDIDRMLAVPSAFSKDGFAMITATNLNDEYVGDTFTWTGNNPASILIYAGDAGVDVEIEVECYNSSGQPQPIEYGYYLGAYNKRGDVASASTAVTSTITFVAPTDMFSLYFTSVNSGYSNTVKIKSIKGGNRYASQRETLNGYFFQNYHLSFDWLLPMFWKYNLPCPNAIFNNEQTATTTTLIQRNRTQNVKWPIGAKADPDCEKLVKTDIGNGMIRKLSVNLSSRVATANLKQDTY